MVGEAGRAALELDAARSSSLRLAAAAAGAEEGVKGGLPPAQAYCRKQQGSTPEGGPLPEQRDE